MRFASLSSRPALAMSVPSAGTSSPGAQLDEVVLHDVGRRHDPHLAVAHDARRRGVEQRQPVELPLREVLLHDADGGVDDEDDPEEPVGERPRDHDEHEERAEDRVEAGQHVGADDLADRARRPLGQPVDGAARDPLGHLGTASAPRAGSGSPAALSCPGASPRVSSPAHCRMPGARLRGGTRSERSGGVVGNAAGRHTIAGRRRWRRTRLLIGLRTRSGAFSRSWDDGTRD